MTVELSDQEMMRYNRQIVLRGFDFEGQEALKTASVLVVGLGGLGCARFRHRVGLQPATSDPAQRCDSRPAKGGLGGSGAVAHQSQRSVHPY